MITAYEIAVAMYDGLYTTEDACHMTTEDMIHELQLLKYDGWEILEAVNPKEIAEDVADAWNEIAGYGGNA